MTTQITTTGATITPLTLENYESARAPRTTIHYIPGRTNGSPDVHLRPASMRRGRIVMVFAGATAEADSLTAFNLLSGTATFNLVSTEYPSAAMSFVVPEGGDGDISRYLEPETRAAWLVGFPYQEFVP